MERLRDAAIKDPYALNELRHLTDNIGPRLSGSPQAGQAVEYVAAEMRALGAEVTLEKAKVPHWVRGQETAEVVAWPGQAPGTTQKVVLTASGRQRSHPGGRRDRGSRGGRQLAATQRARSRGRQGQDPALQSQVRQGTRRPRRWTGSLRRRRGLSWRRSHCGCRIRCDCGAGALRRWR